MSTINPICHRDARPDQDLQGRSGAQVAGPAGAAELHLRVPGAERRREDDDDQAAAGPGAADRRQRPGVRQGHREGERSRSAGRVGYLSQDPRYYEYMTARETLRFTARFFYEGPRAADREPGRGDAGAGGAGRQGGPPDQGLLRRRAPAPGHRPGPGELPGPADPGRAGRLARPASGGGTCWR